MSDNAPTKPSPDPFLLWFDWMLRLMWWALQVAWRWMWWSNSARVIVAIFWFASFMVLIVERSALAMRIFACFSIALMLIFVVPLVWGAYRLFVRVRRPVAAGWRQAGFEVAQQLRFDWIREINELGFPLAGYLRKDGKNVPYVALLVNSESRDSAHVACITGKEFFVFKTRFSDGLAFETANTDSVRLLPANPSNPTFRFPSVRRPSDLYRVHQRIKRRFVPEREPVISNFDGEIAEFISRAEVVRRYMMSRDYRLRTSDNTYAFTPWGALRHAALLTWPVKAFREWLFRRKASKELKKLGFRLDPASGKLVEL